jgi:hypothetical protein
MIAAAWSLLVALATVVALGWLAWTVASVIESARYRRRRHLHLVVPKRPRLFVLRFTKSTNHSSKVPYARA